MLSAVILSDVAGWTYRKMARQTDRRKGRQTQMVKQTDGWTYRKMATQTGYWADRRMDI